MASDAVLKIKKAEDEAAEIVRSAARRAKETVSAALESGLAGRDQIIASAMAKKENILSDALALANADCGEMASAAARERERYENPGQAKFDRAVDIIIERIVN